MSFLSQSKRPKFLLALQIQELANIPKIHGACYVKWHIKDSSLTSQQLKGRTSKVHIKDHRATWDYNYETLLRLAVNGNKVLQEKILVLTVYIGVPEHHHAHQHVSINDELHPENHLQQLEHQIEHFEHQLPKVEKKTVLGKVEINLAEYVNYEEPTSNRYLLQRSKVNCIMTVKIGMELLKGDKSEFIAPSMKSSNIFKGIANVLNESIHDSSTMQSSTGASHHRTGSGSQMSSSDKLHRTIAITSDPVVSKLYEKTFEISWDPRPGELTAGECIDDIFNGGDGWAKNEDGVNLIDLDIKANRTHHTLYQVNDANGDAATKSLLKESEVREDLKSWYISHILP